MSTDVINATNPGPIEGVFSIDLSKGPGAYEFRGARGTGKTTLISSIDWLAGHKVDVTLHDAALSGKIEGFGVVAPIGGRKRRKGDLKLDTIDAEKFSLTDLIAPPGKTPEVRDAHAIKALAVLSEAKAYSELYYELAGGQAAFDALGVQPTDDPVLLATRIKQAYDKLARERQNTAEAEANHAAPLLHVPDDLDVGQSFDLVALGLVRDNARDTAQRIKTEREAGIAKEKDIAQAKSRLKEMGSDYSGPTVKDAAAARQAAIDKGAAVQLTIEKLMRELAEAHAADEACQTEYRAANAIYEAAKTHKCAIDEVAAIASQKADYPTEATATLGAENVADATTAYNRGVRIRDVKMNQEKAKGHRLAAKAAEKQMDWARNQAGQVFDILARSLHTKYLEIRTVEGAPRLFVQHPKRGTTAFDRVNGLSDGERVDFTLRELLPHIKSPGLLPIPQPVWQDLQPSDRKNLHSLAVENGLFIFGAQVDDGDLRIVFLGDAMENDNEDN